MIIYAATNGYLDDIPLDDVSAFETGLYRYMDANHPEIGQEIVEKSVKARNKMSPDLLKSLGAAIEEYKKIAVSPDQSRAAAD
jgi:F-type H+-transporting ATPase subunit alpha